MNDATHIGNTVRQHELERNLRLLGREAARHLGSRVSCHVAGLVLEQLDEVWLILEVDAAIAHLQVRRILLGDTVVALPQHGEDTVCALSDGSPGYGLRVWLAANGTRRRQPLGRLGQERQH